MLVALGECTLFEDLKCGLLLASKILGHFHPLHPLLSGILGLDMFKVRLTQLPFDPQGLESLGKSDPGIGYIPLLLLLEDLESLGLLVLLHDLALLDVSIASRYEVVSPRIHLPHHVGVGSNSPLGEGLSQDISLEQCEEVGADPFGIGLEEPLSRDEADAAENFHSQLSSCNSANQVYSVLLFLDIFSPDAEDVPTLVDIDVVPHSANVGVHGLLVVSLERVTHLNRMVEVA